MKRLDILGKSIDLNFKGRATFQTNLGAIMSLMIVLVVGAYGLLKLLQLVNYDESSFIINSVLKDMYFDYPAPFNGAENKF